MDGVKFDINDVISKYVQLRDQKDAIEAEAKAKKAEIDKSLDLLEAWLLNEANVQGVNSFASDAGTAFVKEVDFVNVSDWNQTLTFIQNNSMWQMLKKDVNKTAVKEFMEATGTPPPGVNYGAKREMQVRRKS
jgi:hypothetical protein